MKDVFRIRFHHLLLALLLTFCGGTRADVLDPPPLPLKPAAANAYGKNKSATDSEKDAVRAMSDSAKKDLSNAEALDQRGRPNRFAPQIGHALFVGDSLTGSHFPVSGGGNDWPTLWAASTNWAGRLVVTNLATNSMTAAKFAQQVALEGPQMKCPGGLAFVFLGQNDYGTDSAATIEANLATIWAAMRDAGRIVIAYKTPSVSNATGQALATRTAVNTWIGQQNDKWDACVDLTGLTEADTVDTIHLTKAGNQTVVNLTNAALTTASISWSPDVAPAQRWQGLGVFRRQSLYYPGLNIETDPTAYDLEVDTNNATTTGISIDGIPVYPFPFPAGQGLKVGIAAATQVSIPNTITLGGDFMMCAWLRPGSRHFGSASNPGVIVGDLANNFFAISGSGGSGSLTAVKPYVRIAGTDIAWTDGVSLRVNEPAFIAVRRVNGLLTSWVNGVSKGAQVSNSGTMTLNSAFYRTLSTGWLQADVYSMTVMSGNVSERDMRHLMRGGSPLTLSGTTELYMDFRDGSGSKPQSLDSSRRILDMSTATNYSWLYPSGLPARGVSGDNGDADLSVSLAGAASIQRFATALTSPRAVTITTTGAKAGATIRFCRETTATGASALNIGTGPLKALAAGQWCDVSWDGTTLRLAAAGSL